MAEAAKLFDAARRAMQQAYAPYSKCSVGAAILTPGGKIFTGANMENASFPEGWCAETSALAHMVMAGLDSIAEVAVVAAPDARLREHGCAFLRLHPGAAIGLPDLRAALEDAGVARQKWPEDVRVVEDFPRTASGKIQKFALRAQLRAEEGIS